MAHCSTRERTKANPARPQNGVHSPPASLEAQRLREIHHEGTKGTKNGGILREDELDLHDKGIHCEDAKGREERHTANGPESSISRFTRLAHHPAAQPYRADRWASNRR